MPRFCSGVIVDTVPDWIRRTSTLEVAHTNLPNAVFRMQMRPITPAARCRTAVTFPSLRQVCFRHSRWGKNALPAGICSSMRYLDNWCSPLRARGKTRIVSTRLRRHDHGVGTGGAVKCFHVSPLRRMWSVFMSFFA